jgi:hypothetical protein
MRYFNRGSDVTLRHTFYDSSGDITSPSSVRLTVTHPSSGFPFRGCMATTYVSMTQLTSTDELAPLGWEGTWNSLASGPGTVWWSIRSDDLSDGVSDGQFELRGNPANLTVLTTT